jgi:putative two-component system response regulator
VLVAIGAVMATAVARSPWLLLVAAAPVALIRTVMSASLQLDARLVARVEQLADAAETHLPPGQRASRCAAELARRLAARRGLAAHECQRVYLATRLLQAMTPDQALPSAPDASTADAHGISGAERACLQLGLRPVAEIIHFCQESFDGRGRPHGLAGQDIPLAARIVAVCTAWTTLTTARAHRPALSEAQAMLVLRAGAGTRWDPDLVARLIDMLRAGDQAVPVPAQGAVPAVTAVTA